MKRLASPTVLVVCLAGCAGVPAPPHDAAPSVAPLANVARGIHRHHPPKRQPVAPEPQVIGQGRGVLLNIVGDDPVIGFIAADGTHVEDLSKGTSKVYVGDLEDLQGGIPLTEVFSATAENSLLLNGSLVATTISDQTPVIAGTAVAYLDGSVYLSSMVAPLFAGPGDLVGLAASGNDIAWVVENATCEVYLNSVLVANDTTGCPDNLKVTVANSIVYVGWSDGTAVFVAQSKDSGLTWTVDSPFAGGEGVFGADYAIRSDGTVIAAWTQYLKGEDGASVWESDAGGLPVRLSAPVKTGFSGAGNPAVASDGSVTYLDDVNGSAAGHFDVFLNGVDLSNTDLAIDEGPVLRLLPDGTRVVAWDDETTVWMELLP